MRRAVCIARVLRQHVELLRLPLDGIHRVEIQRAEVVIERVNDVAVFVFIDIVGY